LFKQLLPNQCQGCVWSRRHKTRKEADKVYTVRATIDQFNAVSRRVMTSIIFPDCRPEARAKIVAKWIEIARVRLLYIFACFFCFSGNNFARFVLYNTDGWTVIGAAKFEEFFVSKGGAVEFAV
jgi:hypothetical protein